MRVFLKVNRDTIQKSLYCGVFGMQGDYVPVNHCLAVMLRELLGDESVKVHYGNMVYFDKEGKILCKSPNSEETKRFFAEFMNLTHDVEQRYAFVGRVIEVDIPVEVVKYYGVATLLERMRMCPNVHLFKETHDNFIY